MTFEKLRARGLAPKKRFGQNFLVDANAAKKIAEAATTPEGGTVLEIGAGLGALTKPLLERAAKVVAIEKDRDLVPILREDIDDPRLTIHEGDALAFDWKELLDDGPRPRVVAGNLPYLITGALLERATEIAAAIDGAVFMVQAEVADRLLARAGDASYGALTVFVHAAFDVKKVVAVKPGAFHPRPEVSSAVVLLTPTRPRRAEETDAFRAAVKAAFSMRRKTLRNAWKNLYGLSKEELEARAREASIDLDARGETLSVDDFARFASLAPTTSP